MSQISKKNAQKWANALRSGKYKQGRFCLNTNDDEWCCLGVACDIFIPRRLQLRNNGRLLGEWPSEQPNAPKWLVGLNQSLLDKHPLCHDFTYLNDCLEYSFDEIADIIELVYVHGALD